MHIHTYTHTHTHSSTPVDMGEHCPVLTELDILNESDAVRRRIFFKISLKVSKGQCYTMSMGLVLNVDMVASKVSFPVIHVSWLAGSPMQKSSHRGGGRVRIDTCGTKTGWGSSKGFHTSNPHTTPPVWGFFCTMFRNHSVVHEWRSQCHF